MTDQTISPEEPEETIRTLCEPDFDCPGLQKFRLEMIHDGVTVATLEAIRMAIFYYDPIIDADAVVKAFDTRSRLCYDLAEALRKRRRAFARTVDGDTSLGLIGITMIKVEPRIRGSRASHRLIDHLRELHSGMRWHVALEAVPMEFKEGPDGPFRAMRARLIDHYSQSGFEQISPRSAPSLMGAFWNGEYN